jgi:hypothetical protein
VTPNRTADLGVPVVAALDTRRVPARLRHVGDAIDPAAIVDRLNAGPPRRRFDVASTGEQLWRFKERVPPRLALGVMVSLVWRDEVPWLHASCWRNRVMPAYDDLKLLHAAVFGARHAYQVFVPPDEHYSGHDTTLHLWGRVDGRRCLPDMRDPITGGV